MCWCLSLILFSTIITKSQGACADWAKSSNVRASDGYFQPDIDSEKSCKKTCLAFFKCEAIDWMEKERRCYLHDAGDTNAPTNRTGSVYFELKRVGDCQVDCIDAFRAKEHSKLNKIGQISLFDNTLSDCKKACIAVNECYGFDWFASNKEGDRCYLQSDANHQTIRNQDSAYYEIGRYWCKANETTSVTFSPIDNTTTSTVGVTKRGTLTGIIVGVTSAVVILIIVLVTWCCVKKAKKGSEKEKLLQIEKTAEPGTLKTAITGSTLNITQTKPNLQQSIVTKVETAPKSEIKASKVNLATTDDAKTSPMTATPSKTEIKGRDVK